MNIEAPFVVLGPIFIAAGLFGIVAIVFAVRAKRDLRSEPLSLIRRITLALMGMILVLMSLAADSMVSGWPRFTLAIWYASAIVGGIVLCLMILMMLLESAR
jgi:cytochrome bd-type quinol oxidase subunit 2